MDNCAQFPHKSSAERAHNGYWLKSAGATYWHHKLGNHQKIDDQVTTAVHKMSKNWSIVFQAGWMSLLSISLTLVRLWCFCCIQNSCKTETVWPGAEPPRAQGLGKGKRLRIALCPQGAIWFRCVPTDIFSRYRLKWICFQPKPACSHLNKGVFSPSRCILNQAWERCLPTAPITGVGGI